MTNDVKQRFALTGRQLFRVVKTCNGTRRIENNRRGNHRPAQWSPPHFINAGDQLNACLRPVKLILLHEFFRAITDITASKASLLASRFSCW